VHTKDTERLETCPAWALSTLVCPIPGAADSTQQRLKLDRRCTDESLVRAESITRLAFADFLRTIWNYRGQRLRITAVLCLVAAGVSREGLLATLTILVPTIVGGLLLGYVLWRLKMWFQNRSDSNARIPPSDA
jgi:hypothetical protein